MKRFCVLLFLVHLGVCTVSAQKDSTLLKEITIKAFNSNKPALLVPTAVSVLTDSSFQRFGNVSLVPVVNTVAGVRMEERSPGSYRFSVRGSLLRSPFGVRNVKFYLNGLPFTDGGGNTYLNLLDFNSIDKIEIIKGTGASLYGAGTGGVVLLETLPDAGPRLSQSLSTGSFGLFRFFVGGEVLRNDKTVFSLKTSYQRSDGYREQSAMRRYTTLADLTHVFNAGNTLSAIAFTSRLFYETPGGLTEEQFKNDPSQARPSGTLPGAEEQKAAVKNNTTYLGLTYTHDWTNQLTTAIGGFASFTDFKNPAIRNFEIRSETNVGFRTTTDWSSKIGEVVTRVTAGGEYQYFDSPVSVYDNLEGKRGDVQVKDVIKSMGGLLFMQATFDFPGDISLTAGVSGNFLTYNFHRQKPLPVVNQEREFDTGFFPRIALLKKLGDNFSIYGSISQGFSPPSLAEVRPSTDNFNSSLLPETGLTTEMGVKGKLKYFGFDVIAYQFRMEDAIVIKRDEDGAEYFVNAGSTRQKGVEAKIFYNAPFFARRLKDFTIWVAYTLNDFYFDQYLQDGVNYAGNRLTGVSPNVLVAGMDIHLKRGFYANFTTSYNDHIPLNDANSVYAEEYWLMGMRTGWLLQRKKLTVDFFAGVDNLLDVRYSLGNDINALGGRYFNVAPPRNVYIGVNTRIK